MWRELFGFSRRELLAFARAEGIRGRHRLRKTELVDALVEAYRRLAESPATLRALKREDLLRLARALSVERRSRLRKRELVDAWLAKWTAWRSSAGAQEAVEAARDGLRCSSEGGEPQEALSSGYGKTRLVLMTIDPYRIHAYWEVVPADLAVARQTLGDEGEEAQTILRIYDVTAISFDGTNAWHTFDVTVGAASNWYLSLWSSGKSFLGEVGLRSPRGHFVPLARSNVTSTPSAGPSDCFEERWAARALPLQDTCVVLPISEREEGGEDVLHVPHPTGEATWMPPGAIWQAVEDRAFAWIDSPVDSKGRLTPDTPDEDLGEGSRGTKGILVRTGGETERGPETPGLAAWRSLERTWVTSPAGPTPPSREP